MLIFFKINEGYKMKNRFIDAINFRHACKVFDETKKIPQDDINYILQCARRSPSSFGMEGWKFLVISNDDLKAKIRPYCWDQIQITSCSDLIVILTAIENLKVESEVPKKRFSRRDLPKEAIDKYMDVYSTHLKDTLSSDKNIYSWGARQTYIAAANMMTGAAFIGIDSCPIEGFEKENVEKILNIDSKKYQISMLLPFGYRLNPQSKQLRVDIDEIVEFIK
jgi:nitroreductase